MFRKLEFLNFWDSGIRIAYTIRAGSEMKDRRLRQQDQVVRHLSPAEAKHLHTGDSAVLVLDPEGRVAGWTTDSKGLLGSLRSEVADRLFHELFAEASPRTVAALLKKAKHSGRFSLQSELRRGGTSFPARLTLSPLERPGGIGLGFLIEIQDLRDPKRRQEHPSPATDSIAPTKGKSTVPPPTTASIDPSNWGPLTARELEVLQLLAIGNTSRQVAFSLGISVRTAETHRKNIMQKLGLGSVIELVRYAMRKGLISP